MTDVGARIRITDPRLQPGRVGTVSRITTSNFRDLYTVRLDRAGWPGGINSLDHGEPGWFVDLRADEFEVYA